MRVGATRQESPLPTRPGTCRLVPPVLEPVGTRCTARPPRLDRRDLLNDIIAPISDTLLAIPGVRFIVGLVDGALRPLWVVALLSAAFYLMTRAGQSLSRGLASRFVVRRTERDYDLSEPHDRNGSPTARR